MRSIPTGIVAGLSVALPLFGGVAGLPSSAIAALLLLAAFLLLAPSIVSSRLYWRILSPPLLAGSVFTFFVLLSTYDSQWEFLFSPHLWRNSANRYFDAKLFMYLLSFGSGAAASVLVLVADDKADMIKGVCLSVTTVSVMAAIRLLVAHGHQLWATDFELARTFFLDAKSFSVVSYGILMMMGAICALRFRWGWAVSAILLACAILLARRADTAIAIFAAILFFVFLCIKERSLSPLRRLLGLALLAALLVYAGINDFSSSYFRNVLISAEGRVEILSSVDEEGISEYIGSRPLISGRLGYLSTGVLGKFRYPHNLPVEIYREVGMGGLIAFITFLLLPIAVALRHMRLLRPDAILSLLLMGAMLGISLKAGDITNAGKILFLATLAYIGIKTSQTASN